MIVYPNMGGGFKDKIENVKLGTLGGTRCNL